MYQLFFFNGAFIFQFFYIMVIALFQLHFLYNFVVFFYTFAKGKKELSFWFEKSQKCQKRDKIFEQQQLLTTHFTTHHTPHQ